MKHLPIPQAGLGAARGPVLSALLALITLCGALTATAALPLPWRADWPNCKPVEKLLHRGSDVALQPTFYINGLAADTNGWTFSTFVQTNAVGAWFGPLPGAFFSHTNDVGASFYNVMVRAETPGGSVNYTAFARFRMLDSPGFTPGELPLPAKVIDFADVTVLNPPWPTNTVSGIDAATATNIAEAAVGELSDMLGVEPVPGTPAPYMVGAARYAVDADRAATSVSASTAQSADSAFGISDNLTGQGYRTAGAIFSQLDAATATNAAQSAALAAIETNIVRATNPNFSNAVLQVGIGVDTNTVAAINALVEAGDELPIGGATSLGALLLALAAAVAALKRTKADASALRYDKIDLGLASPMVQTDSTDPDNPIDYVTLPLTDRAVAALTIDTTIAELRLTFPDTIPGKIRDFGLFIYIQDLIPAPALVPPSGVSFFTGDGKMPTLASHDDHAYTCLYFSEQPFGNIFLVKGEEVKEVS